MAKLTRKFFERDTLLVAKDLLGCFLVRKINGKRVRARIIETEAYIGEDDLACHASKGRTRRTEVMYGKAGHAYVYLIYGMYELLNIVTEQKDFPAAILIRAVEIEGIDQKKTNGPGKLTKILNIDRMFNGVDLINGKELWLDRPASRLQSSEKIIATKRIGIDYAKHCREYLWRFILEK